MFMYINNGEHTLQQAPTSYSSAVKGQERVTISMSWLPTSILCLSWICFSNMALLLNVFLPSLHNLQAQTAKKNPSHKAGESDGQ